MCEVLRLRVHAGNGRRLSEGKKRLRLPLVPPIFGEVFSSGGDYELAFFVSPFSMWRVMDAPRCGADEVPEWSAGECDMVHAKVAASTGNTRQIKM